MPLPATDTDQARIADNLRRAVELTELGLALRQAVLQQRSPHGTCTMTQVMHEIRLAKEQAWRQSRS
jgi:N-acyl-D-aspartate/D-glutamate deacylase